MARKQLYAEQKWSRLVKDRAGRVCQFCGPSDRLESHHIIPASVDPSLLSALSNGVCLCHYHHLAAHGGAYNRYKESGTVPQEDVESVTAFLAELRQTTTAEE